MSVAIYPRSIPAFPVHRNLLDDVDAEHINLIQRELTAIAGILGINPQVYNDVSVAAVVTSAIPNDTGGIDGDTIQYDQAARAFNPLVKVVDHGTVGARLDAVETGQQFHCFRLAASTFSISATATLNLTTRPKGVRFPKPNASQDPNDMYNGVGVNLRKGGFWSLRGSVLFNRQGTSNENAGVYEAVIDRNETYLDGMDRIDAAAGQQSITLSPRLEGFYNKGDRVTLRVAHNTAVNQQIRLAVLSGFLLREG